MNTDTDAEKPFRFGSFELDVRTRELRDGAKTRIRLQEQPFEILRMMLERPGSVVTRDELRQRLWPNGTFVDFEHSLNAAVKRLRAALGDAADNPRFVETLPRRGYRFIAPLESVEREVVETTGSSSARVRLAVLPFTNLSGENGQEYFADGLTEEMIAQLGQLCRGRIGVIARSSCMVFKEGGQRARDIGEALHADYLLEGSVRREGDRVRITARLVETTGETHLWVETFERNVTDVLSVQCDVAQRIARSLTFELVPDTRRDSQPPSTDAAAYQAYLKGRYHWNRVADEGLEESLAFYRQATDLDPSFAGAHAAMARAYVTQAEYYRALPRTALEAARQSAKRALALDPTLFEAHLALGDVRRMLEWDWRGAEAAYAQAIVLNPSAVGVHRSYGLLLAALSRSEEAIRESDRAYELDPLCAVVTAGGTSWVRYVTGDYDTAIARALDAIAIEPRYLAAHRVLAAAYLRVGRGQEAIAVLEKALRVCADDPRVMASLAYATAVAGDRDAAIDLVERLVQLKSWRHIPAYHLALAYVGLGNADAAFASLEQATVDGEPTLANLAVEPRFKPIRSDPRYARLIELLGLADSRQ